MVQTARYREQHEQIRKIVAEFPTSAAAVSETTVRGLLVKFIGKLRAHLGMEDTYLYPAMMNHPDDDVRKTAKRFLDEMGALSETVEQFYAKWSGTGRISADPDGFARDWNVLCAALANRMDREDSDLYAMVDRSVSLKQSA